MTLFSLLAFGLLAAPPTAQFELRALDGASRRIQIPALPNGDWFSIQRAKAVRPEFPTGAQLQFANGDRIAGRFLHGEKDVIVWQAEFGTSEAELRVPLSLIDLVWLAEPPAETPAFADRYPWIESGRKNDILRLGNGEILTGELEGCSESGALLFKRDGKTTSLPTKVVEAIALNPALTVKKATTGLRYQVVTANGSRFTAKAFSGADAQLEATLTSNVKLKMAWNDLIAITAWSNDVVPLSELKPSRVVEVPFGSLAWPWTANCSVKREPLRIKTARGVETFRNGLGTHPSCTLTYDLAGKFRAFEATISLDAVSGKQGIVSVKVLLDGLEQPLARVNPLTAIAGPQAIRVKLEKARTLALVTEFGPGGGVQADVDWIEPRLLK